MALYLISYDIKSYDKEEYPALYAKLDAIGAEKILYSEWIVIDGIGKATAIYNEIAPCVKTKRSPSSTRSDKRRSMGQASNVKR
jgi:hypothetical protein